MSPLDPGSPERSDNRSDATAPDEGPSDPHSTAEESTPSDDEGRAGGEGDDRPESVKTLYFLGGFFGFVFMAGSLGQFVMSSWISGAEIGVYGIGWLGLAAGIYWRKDWVVGYGKAFGAVLTILAAGGLVVSAVGGRLTLSSLTSTVMVVLGVTTVYLAQRSDVEKWQSGTDPQPILGSSRRPVGKPANPATKTAREETPPRTDDSASERGPVETASRRVSGGGEGKPLLALLGVFGLVGAAMGLGTLIMTWSAGTASGLAGIFSAGLTVMFALPLGLVVAALAGHYLASLPGTERSGVRNQAAIAGAVGHAIMLIALVVVLVIGFGLFEILSSPSDGGTSVGQTGATDIPFDFFGKMLLGVVPAGLVGGGTAHILHPGLRPSSGDG